MVNINDNVLPYNLEAERSILGAIILDESLPEGCDPTDFYLEAHRKIYKAASDLFEKGMKADLVTLKNELQMTGDLESVGGAAYLAGLTDGLPRMDLAPQYTKILRNHSAARKIVTLCNEGMARAYEYKETSEEIISSLVNGCDEISSMLETGGGLKHIQELVGPAFNVIESRSHQDSTDALATGFTDLDRLLSGGMRSPNNIVLAARPGHGKTALISNIILNMGSRGEASAFFSMEMGAYEIIERMLSQLAEVDGGRLRTGFINREEWSKLTRAAGDLCDMPIYIDDSTNITTAEMRARTRRLMSKVPIKMVAMDYLQLIDPPSYMRKNTNEFQQIAAISKSIKFMAKELGIVTVPVSQLSRESEKRKDPRPKLSDLRSSGQIEQDADVVVFIYREEINSYTEENAGLSSLIVAKQRNGPIGDIQLAFSKQFTKFQNLYNEY